MNRAASRHLVLAIVLGALGGAACDKAPLVAPIASTISISASSTSLVRGGTTEVVAFVIEEAGTPVHNGTVVRFTATLGRVEPEQAQTRDGVARATFIAGNAAGTARITATSGAAVATEASSNFVEIVIGSTATIALSTTPTNPTVGQPVRLTITPTVAAGGLAPSVAVAWGDGTSTNLGIVAAAREVAHTYTSPGTFTITATASAEETITSSTSVTVGAAGPVSVNVAGNPTVVPRCQPVTFTATATLASGDTGAIVRYEWQIDSGTEEEQEDVVTTGNQLTRVFRTTGTKSVTVDAVTNDGRRGSGQTQIVVRELTGVEVCN